jgi:hypothetical protein
MFLFPFSSISYFSLPSPWKCPLLPFLSSLSRGGPARHHWRSTSATPASFCSISSYSSPPFFLRSAFSMFFVIIFYFQFPYPSAFLCDTPLSSPLSAFIALASFNRSLAYLLLSPFYYSHLLRIRGIFWIFLNELYLTLLHLPSLRFHCVGGCWDRTQGRCDFGIGSETLRTTRRDLNHSARFHRHRLDLI